MKRCVRGWESKHGEMAQKLKLSSVLEQDDAQVAMSRF